MVDTNTIVSVLAMVGVALMGIYLDRVRRGRDKREADIETHFTKIENATAARFKEFEATLKDVDIRVQLADSRSAVLETKAHTQAGALVKLGEDLADIRDNMIRRADLDLFLEQINIRRPHTRKT